MPSEEHYAIIFSYAQTAFVVGVINHVTAAGLYSPPSLMMSVNARRSRPPRLQILYVILHKTQIELLEIKRVWPFSSSAAGRVNELHAPDCRRLFVEDHVSAPDNVPLMFQTRMTLFYLQNTNTF